MAQPVRPTDGCPRTSCATPKRRRPKVGSAWGWRGHLLGYQREEDPVRTTSTPLNIGQVPQLFFDNYVIEMVNFVTRTMHQPKKHPGNPLLRQDKPWEKVVIVRGNTSVYWDESERLFKYWYGDWVGL